MLMQNRVSVLKVKSGSLAVVFKVKAAWRSVLIQTGVQSAEMAGVPMMLQWFVINLVMDEKVYNSLCCHAESGMHRSQRF